MIDFKVFSLVDDNCENKCQKLLCWKFYYKIIYLVYENIIYINFIFGLYVIYLDGIL